MALKAEATPGGNALERIHIETGRARGSLTVVLALPRDESAALGTALRLLHDPRGNADLDTRLGRLAAEAPEGTAFLVGLEESVWVYPSSGIRGRLVRGDLSESIEEPQVVSLSPGESVELVSIAAGSSCARIIRQERAPSPSSSSSDAETGRRQAEKVKHERAAEREPFASALKKARSFALPIAVALASVSVFALSQRGRPKPAPRTDAYQVPFGERVVNLLTQPNRAPEERQLASLGSGTSEVPSPLRTIDPEAPKMQEAPKKGAEWAFQTRGPITSSPLVEENRVVFGCRDSSLYCLNGSTGELAWKIDAGSGVGSSPRAAGGVVVAGTYGGEVLAAALDTGELRWKARVGGKIVSSPAILGNRIVIGSYDRRVHGFDLATGAHCWQLTTGGFVRASVEPAGSARVVAGSSDGFLYCVDSTDGRLVWKHRAPGAVLAAAAFDETSGKIVVGCAEGSVICVAADTGGRLWRSSLGGEFHAQPRFAEGRVLVGSGGGSLVALELATGKRDWTVEAKRGFDARPLVLGRTVIAPTFDGTLHLVELATGSVRARRPLGGQVFTSPASAREHLYLGTLEGTFHALLLDALSLP